MVASTDGLSQDHKTAAANPMHNTATPMTQVSRNGIVRRIG